MKVINEVQEETKSFKSIIEFDAYYRDHKEEMEKQTTQLLNKLYKIEVPDGSVYRITKKNCNKVDGKIKGGEVCLKKVTVQKDDEQPLWEIAIESVKADIASMKAKIEEIKNAVNAVVKVINELQKY